MGALTSAVTAIGKITSTLGAIEGLDSAVRRLGSHAEDDRRDHLRAQQDLALRQLQETQAQSQRIAEEQASLDRARLATDTQAAEEQRRAALKRAVARQRASFGAQGIGSGDGSSEAVLLGLFEESDQDRTARERLDTIRNQVTDQDLSAQRRINVLQRSQMEQKQRLARLYDGA